MQHMVVLSHACHISARGPRGSGTAALEAVLRELHHRVTIDPAADNPTAIRVYERAGFRPVGVLHHSERDRSTGLWRDQLLMEWLADPPDPPGHVPVRTIRHPPLFVVPRSGPIGR